MSTFLLPIIESPILLYASAGLLVAIIVIMILERFKK